MKKHLFISLLVALSTNLFAQTRVLRIQSKCRNIYVWDFLDQDKNKNRTTNDLTEAVEEALTNIDDCFVLQRRNLATLVNHAAAEKGINSVKEMRYEITHALEGGGAKLVLFGVVDMSARDACEVKLRVEDLTTSRIISAKSTRILYAEIANIDNRNRVIKRLVSELVGKPFTELQTVQSREGFNPYRKNLRISSPGQPDNSSAAPNSRNFTLSPKSGLSLIMGTCTGDANNQTVTINFTFINNIANLVFKLPASYGGATFASDMDGNQYPLSYFSLGGETDKGIYGELDKQFFTGTKLRASITFANILPSVKKLAVAKVQFSKAFFGQNYGDLEDLTFRDLAINWR